MWFTLKKIIRFSVLGLGLLVVIAVKITDLVMCKLSYKDKMRMQTFHEIGSKY